MWNPTLENSLPHGFGVELGTSEGRGMGQVIGGTCSVISRHLLRAVCFLQDGKVEGLQSSGFALNCLNETELHEAGSLSGREDSATAYMDLANLCGLNCLDFMVRSLRTVISSMGPRTTQSVIRE
jgi:hypothetical protein